MYSEALSISPHAKNPDFPSIVRASGCFLYGESGQSYLDMTGGSGAVNLGYQRPEILEIIHSQSDRLVHTGWNIDHPLRHQMIDKLASLMPFGSAAVMGAVTGAEGIEVALKIARAKTGRRGIFYFGNAYHGKTQGALAITDNPTFREFLVAEGLENTRFKLDGYEEGDGSDLAVALHECLQDLASKGRLPAAMIIEPVQGAEGIYPVSEAALSEILHVCRTYGVLSIFDEIYTGFGRLGQPFGATKSLLPDLMVIGKSLANGLPIAAVVGHPEIVNVLGYAAHSSTFTFSPLTCAVAAQVITLHLDERPWKNALSTGQLLENRLAELSQKDPRIQRIRGRGLMLAFDFVDESTRARSTASTRLAETLGKNGVLVRTGGVSGTTVKLTPPLTISESEVAYFIEKLVQSLSALNPVGSIEALSRI